jgi:hypothetical protein
MEQDYPTIVPPSEDGIYDLAEAEPTPAPALPIDLAPPAAAAEKAGVANGAAKVKSKTKPQAGGGLLGLFQRKAAPARAPEPPKSDAAAEPPKADAGGGQAPPGGDGASAGARPAPGPGGPKLRIRRRKRKWIYDLPAWAVSLIAHLSMLSVLALATMAPQIQRLATQIDAAPLDPKLSGEQAEEMLHVLAEPTGVSSDQAVVAFPSSTPGAGTGLGTGTGAPSATPSVSGGRGVGERSLPNVKVVPNLSPSALMPRALTRDLGGGGQIAGEVTRETGTIGEALDQLAREILRHLAAHKLVVVWMFDESGSMKDDQQAIKEKFDRVASELKLNVPDDKKSANALTHVIVGFGEGLNPVAGQPTADIDSIGRAIDRIPVDETGVENTCQALQRVVGQYGKFISSKENRRVVIVLVTDESGDDGSSVEEARQALVSRNVPLYVIGRQSLFGYSTAHLLYVDPVTKDHYWPGIRRGPETAGIECLQWDGLHDRWDEQPSGFAPYELARLVKDTGGIYFLLPSEENMRVRQREKKYKMSTLKEYVPDYKSRGEYLKERNASEFRRSLFAIIEGTREFPFRRHFPVDYAALEQAILQEYPVVEQRLGLLLEVEQKLRSLAKHREREPDKRWQAHYDLMLAQVVTYQIKAYEYRACLKEMVALAQKGQLRPGRAPVPGQLVVEWVLDHSHDRKAPKGETEKKYAEAESLLKAVIAKHPSTPWSDLAQDEIDRGFGVQRNEWHHNPKYDERAQLVPKY